MDMVTRYIPHQALWEILMDVGRPVTRNRRSASILLDLTKDLTSDIGVWRSGLVTLDVF